MRVTLYIHHACVKLFIVYSSPLLFRRSGKAHGEERASACGEEQQHRGRRKPRATSFPIPEEI
ncbi:hypothetical protein AB205_0039990 [Aquarana catesbeiana]|uniref:Uncharacterized protein n=1 Tax=Aquarana catesbeiana TaxID=8400 RepID=A0A2G9QAH9_AQUCT|nr:hypothetical protein AB205_0039990 [Aquarana catesbeiana]